MYCLGSCEHRRWGIDKDTARNAIAGAALAVSILPFMFGWLGKITRDARDRRIIEEAKGLIRQRPSISEMYRLHICIVVAQNKIDGRRVRRAHRRTRFWLLMIPALVLGLWLNFVVYIYQPDMSIGRDEAILYTAQAGSLVALALVGYVMVTIYIPAYQVQKMVEYFGVSRRPRLPPLLAFYGHTLSLTPDHLFRRCYARTAVALRRRPYSGGYGELRGFVDSEFTRRLMIEIEHEQIRLIRAAARFKKRRLFWFGLTAPCRQFSRKTRRRIYRRKWAFARKIRRIPPERQPSQELRQVLNAYIEESSK